MFVNFTSLAQMFALGTGKPGTFDWATANTSVWLSAAAYCDTNTYLTRTYRGYSQGFNASYVIEYARRDVQVWQHGIFFGHDVLKLARLLYRVGLHW
jgi:hypothetical protein